MAIDQLFNPINPEAFKKQAAFAKIRRAPSTFRNHFKAGLSEVTPCHIRLIQATGPEWNRPRAFELFPQGKLNMKNVDNIFAAIVLLALLLLSAWGNATLLLVVSAILFVAGLVVFRMDTFRRKLLALAAVVGSAVGVAIAIVFR